MVPENKQQPKMQMKILKTIQNFSTMCHNQNAKYQNTQQTASLWSEQKMYSNCKAHFFLSGNITTVPQQCHENKQSKQTKKSNKPQI